MSTARVRVLAWMWLLVLILVGCAKKAEPAYYPQEEMAGYGMADMDDAEVMLAEATSSRSGRARSAPARKSRPMAASAPMPAAPPPPPQEGMAPPEPAPAQAAPARMVHYSGWARIRVVKPEEAADRVVALAKEVGGEVERVSTTVVTIRVPVARFQEAFDQLVGELGDVLDKGISAEDVTEAFQSMELRLGTAKKTRDRLVELLAKSDNEQEKLALVREIQRVTEEIDRMEAQLRTLSRLASMSRITVELVPRQAQAWAGQAEDTAELRWLRGLSPFRPDHVALYGKRLSLAVPEGMVQLTPKKRFLAESADGARIWSGRLDNEPQGSAAFWVGALKERLGPEFASAAVRTVGGFTVLTLVDRSDEPYTWLIAVRESGRKLDVVEAYFPTPAQTSRYQAAVEAVLTAAGGAA